MRVAKYVTVLSFGLALSSSALAGDTAAIATSSSAAPAAAPVAKPTGPDPDKVMQWLKTGNAAFASGNMSRPNTSAARLKEVAKGQHPFATVLSCSDSRVPVELLFDRGVGDLFVVRVAGNVADTDELGTIEYGVDHLGTPVLVVLGHTSCGAVTAVATGAEVHGHIPALVDNIAPAIETAKKGRPDLDPKDLVPHAIQANVFQGMADVITKSKQVRDRLRNEQVRIVGGIYHLDDGHVEWLGSHPDQNALIEKGDRDYKPVDHAAGAHAGGGAPHDSSQAAHAPAASEHEAPPLGAPWLFGVVAFLGALGGVISGRLSARE